MSKRAIFLAGLLVLSVCFSLQGQSESELQHFLSFFHDKSEASLETSLHAANTRLEQAREIGDGRNAAAILRELGLLHLTQAHNYESAMDFLIRSLAIQDSLHLDSERVLTYVAIARVFEAVGDYFKCAQFLEQALMINRENRDINVDAMILNSLGKVSASMGRLDDALGHYRKALRYRDDIERPLEAEALFYMGHLFMQQGDYTRALDHHKRALSLTRRVGDRYQEAVLLNDIGILYQRMNNASKSLANHEVALEIRKSLNEKVGMAESYTNIGSLHLDGGDAGRAIENGLRAMELAREAQAREQIFRSYELLSQAYKHMDNHRDALHYKELSLAIYEFIQNEKQERQVLETQNRYVVGKKENEIEDLEALRRAGDERIAAQNRFHNILLVVVALIGIIAGLLLILYLVKRRSNRILQVAKHEVQQQNTRLQELVHTKDKFFSIISHDVKGPLNSLTSFARLLMDHTDKLSREEIQMLARDLDKSLKNLFALLENLLEWSRSQTGNIDFASEVFDLGEIFSTNRDLLEAQAANKGIRIEQEGDESCWVKLHRQSINTVVRNLVSNAIKFSNRGGTVRLSVLRNATSVGFSVADEGVGMSAEVVNKLFRIDQKHTTQGTASEKGTGLGLILCREFVEKNGGTITVKSTPGRGSIFTCLFPLKVHVNTTAKITVEATF